jgi:hypothetical protein
MLLRGWPGADRIWGRSPCSSFVVFSCVFFVAVVVYGVLCASGSIICLVWIVCMGLIWVEDLYVAWSMGLGKPC